MKNILVSGLATLDMIFHLEDLPADGRKYRATGSLITGGGNASNASIAIARLGGSATLVTTIGEDVFGTLILKELRKEKVKTHAIFKNPNLKTSFSSVVIDQKGERQIINYRSPDLDFSQSSVIDKKTYHAYLTDGRLPKVTLLTLEAARKKKKPGVLDAEEPVSLQAVKLASHVAFSRQGLSSFSNSSSILEGLKTVHNHSNSWVCVTNGEEGTFFLNDNELVQLKPSKISVVDTLGAGDVWHGAFTLALAHAESPIQSCIFANKVASKKCENYGGKNGSPYKDELKLIKGIPQILFD